MLLVRGTVLYSTSIFLIINILAVFFSSTMGVSNIGDVVTNALFDEDSLNTTNPDINPELDTGIQKELQAEAETSELLNFVDGLKKVFSFLITLLTIGFALMNMLIQTGSPILIIWVVGSTVTIGFHISIVSAIRGFSV